MAKQLIIFPFNGNGREAVSGAMHVCADGMSWELLGFIDDDPQRHGLNFHGIPVLGGREQLARWPNALVLAVPGRPETFKKRLDIIRGLGLPRERFATILHPSVMTGPGVSLGSNVLIMANTVLTASVSVEDHVIILPNTTVSHDCVLRAGTIVGSNVCISGGVTIGPAAYIGSGANIRHELSIGEHALVGLGSVVVSDVPANVTTAGCPARPVVRTPPDGSPGRFTEGGREP